MSPSARSSRRRPSGSPRNRPARPSPGPAKAEPAKAEPAKAKAEPVTAQQKAATPGLAPEERPEPGWLTRKVTAVPPRVREVALVVSGAVVSVWAAVLLAVAGAFLTPLRVGTIQAPVSIVLGIGGNALIMWFAYRVTRNKFLALLPGLIWVALTFLGSGTTSERDLVLLGNWVAITYLYSGCATVGVVAYRLLVPRPPRS